MNVLQAANKKPKAVDRIMEINIRLLEVTGSLIPKEVAIMCEQLMESDLWQTRLLDCLRYASSSCCGYIASQTVSQVKLNLSQRPL